jgi:DNA repair protein RadC
MAYQRHRLKRSHREEAPKDRLKRLGPKALTDHELLATVLSESSPGKRILHIAHQVIEICVPGSIPGHGDVSNLRGFCELEEAHACKILACFELGKRYFERAAKPRLSTPEDVYEHLRSMSTLNKEAFRGLYLDVKGQLVHDEMVSLGTLSMNLVHPREVFRPAVEHSAASLILAHNHPSGDPTPSAEDLRVTRQLAEVGRLLDIEVLDHVIVGAEGFVSLRRRGLIET